MSAEPILLETERLLLRVPAPADVPLFLPLIADYAIAKNLMRVPNPYTEEDALAYVRLATEGWASGDHLGFSIRRKTDDAYVGMCAVLPARNWEIGYWIGKPFWGQGFATEAAGRLIAFAFEDRNARCLKAEWFRDNPASGRVLAKLGFWHKGETLSHCLARGLKVPAHVMQLDRATYVTRKMAP